MLKSGTTGKKLTPNQMAKELICDALESYTDSISCKLGMEDATEKELQQVCDQFEKHMNRVYKLMNNKY